MSEIGIAPPADAGAFRGATVIALVAVGVLAFAAMLVLGAFAPDFRSGRNGGAHALSNAAVGFSGLVRLAEATGRNPQIVRAQNFTESDLVVLTPENGATDMSTALSDRASLPTLIVMPKWATVGDPAQRGWVRMLGPWERGDAAGVLAPQYQLKFSLYKSGGVPLVSHAAPGYGMRFAAAHPMQVFTGANVTPIISDAKGNVVVGQLGDKPLYVLSDPDLLSNLGMRDENQARAALELLDYLQPNHADAVYFDVSLNGFGASRSPLKLLFTPPFVVVTLGLVAAFLLAGWQVFVRFGPPRHRVRAIAFGKAALIDNAALLVRHARREGGLGARYADMMRERAAIVFGAPARLRDGALDAYLDRLGGREKFTQLAETAREAHDRQGVLAAAQALHRWRWERSK
ncbi:MAG: hypothetical protein M3R41_11420 [Pseudomonadota bacterium]|nr:hypothetical protein [Pseudomonadota bacterium]